MRLALLPIWSRGERITADGRNSEDGFLAGGAIGAFFGPRQDGALRVANTIILGQPIGRSTGANCEVTFLNISCEGF